MPTFLKNLFLNESSPLYKFADFFYIECAICLFYRGFILGCAATTVLIALVSILIV